MVVMEKPKRTKNKEVYGIQHKVMIEEGASLNSLNFIRHNDRIVFPDRFTFHRLIVELTIVRLIVTMISAVQSSASTRETWKQIIRDLQS